jgi:hypothetical protein
MSRQDISSSRAIAVDRWGEGVILGGFASGGPMQEVEGLEGRGVLRIRFVDDDEGVLSVLELEIPRTEPVVADIHQALFAIGVHSPRWRSALRGGSVLERLRLSERGRPRLAAESHLDVQTAVMDVVQRRLVDSVRPGLVVVRSGPQEERTSAVG